MSERKLPVGIENFEELRRNQYYYIDKTGLMEQLFDSLGKVSLFTRPRRFGKTLNMSMLKCFFEIGTDPSLFDGLYISENKTLCEQHMGKYPVIFLSLKNVEGADFEDAKRQMMELIAKEAERHAVLQNSEALSENAKKAYAALVTFSNGRYQMPEEALLSDYHLENRFSEAKDWYDGYRFGKADVYCPWDVINFVDRAKDDPEARPEAYWINTSGNDLVKRFIDKANKTTKRDRAPD